MKAFENFLDCVINTIFAILFTSNDKYGINYQFKELANMVKKSTNYDQFFTNFQNWLVEYLCELLYDNDFNKDIDALLKLFNEIDYINYKNFLRWDDIDNIENLYFLSIIKENDKLSEFIKENLILKMKLDINLDKTEFSLYNLKSLIGFYEKYLTES